MIDGTSNYLDRKYVFIDYFKHGQKYNKEADLKRISYLFENMPETLSYYEKTRRREKYLYHKHWLLTAARAIKKARSQVMFIADFDDRYFEGFA